MRDMCHYILLSCSALFLYHHRIQGITQTIKQNPIYQLILKILTFHSSLVDYACRHTPNEKTQCKLCTFRSAAGVFIFITKCVKCSHTIWMQLSFFYIFKSLVCYNKMNTISNNSLTLIRCK